MSKAWHVESVACRKRVMVKAWHVESVACRKRGMSKAWHVESVACRKRGMSKAWHVERESVACGKTCLEDRNNFSTVWNDSSGRTLRNSGATGSLSSIVVTWPCTQRA